MNVTASPPRLRLNALGFLPAVIATGLILAGTGDAGALPPANATPANVTTANATTANATTANATTATGTPAATTPAATTPAAATPAAATPAIEQLFNRGLTRLPTSLDPQKAVSDDEIALARDLFEGLVVYGPHGEILPGLATDWAVSPDRLTWTFHLRRGARWSNGETVVGHDIVFALQRLADPANGLDATILRPVVGATDIAAGKATPETLGISATDGSLEIHLTQPTPWLLQNLAAPAAVALNPKTVASLGKGLDDATNLITNGAFVVGSIDPGKRLSLARNLAFHDSAKVAIDTVNDLVFADAADCVAQFRAGAVDFCPAVPPASVPDIAHANGPAFRNLARAGGIHLIVNTAREPWNDVRLRQALANAPDRNAIAASAWGYGQTTAFSLVPPGTANDNGGPGAMIESGARQSDREDEVKRLIPQMPYGKAPGVKMDLIYTASDGNRLTVAALAAAWSSQLKIEVTQQVVDAGAFSDRLKAGDFDLALAAAPAGAVNDPQPYLAFLTSSDPAVNPTRWLNPIFNEEMAAADTQPDIGKRSEQLVAAEHMVVAEMPVIPLLFPSAHWLVSPKLGGWADNVLALMPAQYLTKLP